LGPPPASGGGPAPAIAPHERKQQSISTGSISIPAVGTGTGTASPRANALLILGLAFGTFAIGSRASSPVWGSSSSSPPTWASAPPTASWAITAYALGVVIGAPTITILAARLNRRALLLSITGLFVVGNPFSAAARDLGLLMIGRFLAGMPQGASFGVGTVVATTSGVRNNRVSPRERPLVASRNVQTPARSFADEGLSVMRRVDAGGLKPNTWQRFERLGSAWNQAKLGIDDKPQGAGEGEPAVIAKPGRRARTPLTESQVDAIRTARANGESVISICRRFDVHRMTVWTYTRDLLGIAR